jgi:hypothetical protein
MISVKKMVSIFALLSVLLGFSLKAAAEDFTCTVKSPEDYAGKTFDIINNSRHSKTVMLNDIPVPSGLKAISTKYSLKLSDSVEHYDSVDDRTVLVLISQNSGTEQGVQAQLWIEIPGSTEYRIVRSICEIKR